MYLFLKILIDFLAFWKRRRGGYSFVHTCSIHTRLSLKTKFASKKTKNRSKNLYLLFSRLGRLVEFVRRHTHVIEDVSQLSRIDTAIISNIVFAPKEF